MLGSDMPRCVTSPIGSPFTSVLYPTSAQTYSKADAPADRERAFLAIDLHSIDVKVDTEPDVVAFFPRLLPCHLLIMSVGKPARYVRAADAKLTGMSRSPEIGDLISIQAPPAEVPSSKKRRSVSG